MLPRLCERVVLPSVVRAELGAADAPVRVQSWIANPPTWLDIVLGPMVVNPAGIHKGEAAAIALAGSMGADLLLIDDRRGVRAAKQQGLRVTGTLGILDLAAERGLLDFRSALEKLKRTTFRRPEAVMNVLLSKHRERE